MNVCEYCNFEYLEAGTIREISNLKLRRSHGIINIAAWSILMIIGSIIARYFKQWDPIWFYLHASIQIFGFLAGIVGIFCGLVLSKKLDSNVTHHKNIAILIIVLGCLQVNFSITYSFFQFTFESSSRYDISTTNLNINKKI
jgi:uncharacterized protein YacL